MKMYVARHTQTNYNVQHILNSDPSVDVHLTAKGIEQAQRLTRKLASEKIEKIYISELPRTRQTASYINELHKVPIEVDARLNDNRSGYERESSWRYLKAFATSPDKWHARFNDGESFADVRYRVNEFLSDLTKQDYSAVLVITSSAVIESMYGVLKDVGFTRAALYRIPQGDYDTFILKK